MMRTKINYPYGISSRKKARIQRDDLSDEIINSGQKGRLSVFIENCKFLFLITVKHIAEGGYHPSQIRKLLHF